MLNESQLRSILLSSETNWVERKKSFHPTDTKTVIVAFANSVPERQHAVLFIGVGPDGKFTHVGNADKTQRDIRRIAEQECFPAIRCSPTVVREGGVELIAVVVEFSKERPHFAGHAYIRVGSETRKASLEVMADLIASRNDKVRRLLVDKGHLVTVIAKSRFNMHFPGRMLRGENPDVKTDRLEHSECRVESCDTFVLHYHEVATAVNHAAPIDSIVIDYDTEEQRTLLIIDRRLS